MKYILFLFLGIGICSCESNRTANINPSNLKRLEAVTSLGDTLYSYAVQDSLTELNYQMAKDAYDANPEDVEAIIWLGRRIAYMGRYREAIDVYSEGIKKAPMDARLYRHRGHRYISIREYDKAIKDLEYATKLIIGKKNKIEPDGIPNEQGIPISSLHGNIYYHLALAYYLKNDLMEALRVYDLRTATNQNDDNLVSTTHWKYMSLKSAGHHDEAKRLIAKIDGSLKVIENMAYWEMCLFYKGTLKEDWFVEKLKSTSNKDVFLYGLGNWHLYETKDTIKAKRYYQQLLDEGSMASFAYLAAEADMVRLAADRE